MYIRPIDGNMNDYLRSKNIFYGSYIINLTEQNSRLRSDIQIRTIKAESL